MNRQHSELMDRVYASTRHVYDITRKYYLFGRDQLIRNLDAKPGQVVCEVGCGTARNIVQAAKRYPQARFCGLDASQLMLETAKGNLARAGLKDVPLAHAFAETFEPIDVFPEGFHQVDHFVFSFSLTMIPPWEQSLAHCWEKLKPGGALHIADFGELQTWPAIGRKPFLGFLAAFHVTPQQAIHDWQPADGNFSRQQSVIWGGYSVVTTLRKV